MGGTYHPLFSGSFFSAIIYTEQYFPCNGISWTFWVTGTPRLPVTETIPSELIKIQMLSMQYSNFPDMHHYTNLDKNLLIIEVVAYAFGHLLLTKMSKVEIAHSGAIITYNFEFCSVVDKQQLTLHDLMFMYNYPSEHGVFSGFSVPDVVITIFVPHLYVTPPRGNHYRTTKRTCVRRVGPLTTTTRDRVK